LGLALALPAAAQTSQATPARINIDNFGRVNANYFRGAQPEGGDYADLKTLGVKTVIDLQADGPSSEAGAVKSAGMNFVRIGMTTTKAPTDAQKKWYLNLSRTTGEIASCGSGCFSCSAMP